MDLVGTPDKAIDHPESAGSGEECAKKGNGFRATVGIRTIGRTKKFPTAADLDAVSPDNPVLLGRIDGHAAWVNRRSD